MSAINNCQKCRGVNWDAGMGSFKPSKRHQKKEHKRVATESCVITRRKGKVIKVSRSTKMEEIYV